MSDVTKRTVFYYKDKEYIKFLPFCMATVNGVNYVEPWNGLVSPNYAQVGDGMSAEWNPQNSCNLITDMKEVDVDKFGILLSGNADDPRLHGGILNTRVGK